MYMIGVKNLDDMIEALELIERWYYREEVDSLGLDSIINRTKKEFSRELIEAIELYRLDGKTAEDMSKKGGVLNEI